MKNYSPLVQFILLFLIASTLDSCSNKKTIDDGFYFQSFDDLKAWDPFTQVTDEKSHSGMFCTYTDTTHEFSQTFEMKAADAVKKGYKSLQVTAWCMKMIMESKAQLVVSIESAGSQSMPRQTADFSKALEARDTWINVVVPLKIPDQLPADSRIKVYLWSPSKEKCYMDDVQIEFKK